MACQPFEAMSNWVVLSVFGAWWERSSPVQRSRSTELNDSFTYHECDAAIEQERQLSQTRTMGGTRNLKLRGQRGGKG